MEHPDLPITIEKGPAELIGDGAQLLRVEEDASGKGPMSRYVAIITGDNGVSVAVELAITDSQLSVGDLG